MKTLILLAILCIVSVMSSSPDVADAENEIDNMAIQDENIDTAVSDKENKIEDMPIQDENKDDQDDKASEDETNDPDLMMSDEGELENEKRAVRRPVLIGGCNFNDGYRKCPRIHVHNWLEHHDSGCNDVSFYCRYLKSYGFCNRKSAFFNVMKAKCRRTCGICADPCRDLTPVRLCGQLRRYGFCRKNNPFYGNMRKQCRKTCRLCKPHKRSLKTKVRNASVRYYTYKTWIKKIPAVRTCKCNPKTGVCGKLNFCVSFRYALSNVRTNRLTNSLRIYSYSYNTYVLNKRRKVRHSFTKPRYIYVPRGAPGQENKWKLMKANVQLECGSRFYFNVYTGSRQSKVVKLDDFYVKVGKCP